MLSVDTSSELASCIIEPLFVAKLAIAASVHRRVKQRNKPPEPCRPGGRRAHRCVGGVRRAKMAAGLGEGRKTELLLSFAK